MRIEECVSCFKNKRNDITEKIEFIHRLFLMKITKRANECAECAKKRHIKIFDRHNALNWIASISAGGVEINWAHYVKILRVSDADRKSGATRVLIDLGIILTRPAGAYGIILGDMIMGPMANNFLMLYFKRKSDAAEFAGLAIIGKDDYKVIEMARGAA